MGIGFVLIFYLVVFSVLAAISGSLLVIATRRYLQTALEGRAKAVLMAGLFPFACVLFAGLWFVCYAIINDTVFHRDPMIGDGWYTEIGNGYAIDMIDVTDHGFVHLVGSDGLNSPSAINGVRRLQIVGDQIYGTRDTKTVENFGSGIELEDNFFALNTKSHIRKDFPTEAALAADAKLRGIDLKMEPINTVFYRYRIGWFDWAACLVLIVTPTVTFLWLLRHIRLIKRQIVVIQLSE
ncbi:MAG: hypothetical protein ABSA39_17935 [Edaphobacter sp.]